MLLHVEKAGVDPVFGLGRRVVEDPSAYFLLADGLFLVVASAIQQLIARGEALFLVRLEVIALEEAADAEADFGLRPVRLAEALFADLLELSGAEAQDALDEFLVLFLAPVVALLDIEVLEVEGSILEDDVLGVLTDQALPHLDHIVTLRDVQHVVHRADTHVVPRQQMALSSVNRSSGGRLLGLHC